MSMKIQDDLMTVEDAADLIGLHHTTLRVHIRRKHIPFKKIGRDYLLRREDVIAFRDEKDRLAETDKRYKSSRSKDT